MNAKVIKIHNINELPQDVDPIYMIGKEFPISNDREWKYITPQAISDGKPNPFTYRNTMFFIFKGKRVKPKE